MIKNEWQGYVVNNTWTSADGRTTELSDMNEDYLVNVLILLNKQIKELTSIKTYYGTPADVETLGYILTLKDRSLNIILSELNKRYNV